MRKKTILLFMLIFTSNIFAEISLIDSLKNDVENNTGTNKIISLNLLSKAYWQIDPEMSLEYGEQALSLSQQLGYIKGEAKAINNIGVGYYYSGDFEQSIRYLEESLEIRIEIGDKMEIITALNNLGIVYQDHSKYEIALEYYLRSLKIEEEIGNKNGIAGSLNNIGMVYKNLSNFNKALEFFLRSLRLYEEMKNLPGQAATFGNIGITFSNLTNYDKALEYHLNALKIYEEIEDINGVASALGNIGSIYDDIDNHNMALEYYLKSLKIEEELGNMVDIAGKLNNIGIIYDDLKQYDKALNYYMRSLEMYQEIKDINGIADASNNIGVVYENLGDFNNSLKYLLKALNNYNKIGRKKGIAASMNNVGSVYFKQKDYNHALDYFLQGLQLAKEIKVYDLIIEIYSKLADVYVAKNNFRKALEYQYLYSSIKDSIFSKERMEIIASMETTYEVELLLEEQEKEIELLQKDNEIYKLQADKQNLAVLLLVFGLLIVLVLVFVIYYRYTLTRKARTVLEKTVDERTKDLTKTNIKLKKEISERKELQSQLIRSERLAGIGELAAGIAHEIRNPLGNISSSAQICLNKYKPNKEIKQFLEIIEEDSRKANAIIKGLLDFANPREVKFQKGSICDVIAKIVSSIKARCQENKINIITKFQEKLPPILIDKKWLEQAFLNFTLNAINAMPDGGELIISSDLDKKKKKIVITFSDTGTGIDRKNLSKIFDPFFTTRKDGVGLGLSLSYQIIKDHQGLINIESELNKGTKIIILLPI